VNELPDTAEAMEARETSRKLPVGWLVLFWGLVGWGAIYLYLYSPGLGGWSQAGEYSRALEKK
jgi:N-terminal domain of cytochrome oxidase-cbb3, FixP